MILFRLANLALKQALRHRIRTILSIAGVATGMFLFTAVETLQFSLQKATQEEAGDHTLVVYRDNRFCPLTSRLPEHYLSDIRQINGVSEAIPVQIVVNNCGASLDVIAFRGVPPANLKRYNTDLNVVDGSYEEWEKRSDGALVGQHLAARRGLKPGDTFEAVGVRVHVAGIVQSPLPQDNNVAYVHLNFLQQSSRVGLGTVTQFNVRTDGSRPMEDIANQIDTLFASDAEPTDTRPEKAFFAQTAKDMIEIISFSRWIGLAAVLTVLALVSNALLLVARGRVKENAILQTLGYSRVQVSLLLLWEGVILGLCGGGLGSLLATMFFHFKRYTFGNEGLTLALEPNITVTITGMGLAMLLGLLASLWPAYLTSRQSIISSLAQV